jgi:hypothetical protein
MPDHPQDTTVTALSNLTTTTPHQGTKLGDFSGAKQGEAGAGAGAGDGPEGEEKKSAAAETEAEMASVYLSLAPPDAVAAALAAREKRLAAEAEAGADAGAEAEARGEATAEVKDEAGDGTAAPSEGVDSTSGAHGIKEADKPVSSASAASLAVPASTPAATPAATPPPVVPSLPPHMSRERSFYENQRFVTGHFISIARSTLEVTSLRIQFYKIIKTKNSENLINI